MYTDVVNPQRLQFPEWTLRHDIVWSEEISLEISFCMQMSNKLAQNKIASCPRRQAAI